MSSEKYTFVKGGLMLQTQLAPNVDETYDLFVDATAVRKQESMQKREEMIETILRLIQEVEGTPSDHDDLGLAIGFQHIGYGVYGMSAEILRPIISDENASILATGAMRKMARNIGLYKKNMIEGMVYASVSREHGITLETNPVASSSMETDGSEYSADSPTINLYSHNLYTHASQLICISGLIALAKAR